MQKKLLLPLGLTGLTLASWALQISDYHNPAVAGVLGTGAVISWAWWLLTREGEFPAPAPRVVFKVSPLFTEKRQALIREGLAVFHRYLTSVGFDVPLDVPPIGVDPQIAGSGGTMVWAHPGESYDAAICIGKSDLDDPSGVQRMYAQWTFQRLLGPTPNGPASSPERRFEWQLIWLYKDYYTASFHRQPFNPGPKTANANWKDVLWKIREKYGQDIADRMLFYAYKKLTPPDPIDTGFDQCFARCYLGGVSVVDNLGETYGEVKEILRTAGIML